MQSVNLKPIASIGLIQCFTEAQQYQFAAIVLYDLQIVIVHRQIKQLAALIRWQVPHQAPARRGFQALGFRQRAHNQVGEQALLRSEQLQDLSTLPYLVLRHTAR